MLTTEQHEARKRALAANQAQDLEPFEMFDAPPVLFKK